MTFDFNQDALIRYLQENQQPCQWQKETGQIYITYQLKGYEVPVFFLMRDSDLLQMVAYLPYQIPDNSLAEVARMLHILNRELDLPGFGMDENEKLIFYRSTIVCFEKKVSKRLFNMSLGTTKIACDTFMNAIGLIVSGTMRVDEALQAARRG